MNRPNKKDYWGIETKEYIDYKEYVKDLENYCDELEEWLKYVTAVAETNQEMADENEKLEMALDKACEELESLDYHNEKRQNPFAYTCDYKDAKQWKEWLMKKEE